MYVDMATGFGAWAAGLMSSLTACAVCK